MVATTGRMASSTPVTYTKPAVKGLVGAKRCAIGTQDQLYRLATSCVDGACLCSTSLHSSCLGLSKLPCAQKRG